MVFSNPDLTVNERKLAVLSQAIEEVQRAHPGKEHVNPRHLERAAQRLLTVEAF